MRFIAPISERILLYLSAAGASCALYRRGQLSQVRYLPGEEEGWESFNELLMANPNMPVAIAVDSVDEIYRAEILPRAFGRDRAEMTARRLRQLVHQSPYRAALRQGREKSDGARGDRYLIMGLTNPEQVRSWLDIIHLRATPLAGIWLLPSLSDGLIRRFNLKDPHLLVVSEQTGGLRLSYLEGGELRFSRLAPVDGAQFDDPLEGYAQEIGRTRQALVGQRLITREDSLKVVFLDPLDTLDGLHAFLPESAGFQCSSIERGRLIDTLGLPPELLAESADALYLALLAWAPASANLMTPEQRTLTRRFWFSRGLRFAAATWLALSLAFSCLLLADAWRLQRHGAELEEQTAQLYRRESALLDPVGGEAQLRRRLAAVEAWNAVSLVDKSPGPLLVTAGDAAAGIPDLQLNRLLWREDGVPALTLEGEFPGFAGDYLKSHARIRDFALQLERRLPGYAVRVLAWPLEIAPDRIQQGEIGHGVSAAHFQLELRRKP